VLPRMHGGERAATVAERLSAPLVEQHPFRFDEQAVPVTISVGVACVVGPKGRRAVRP